MKVSARGPTLVLIRAVALGNHAIAVAAAVLLFVELRDHGLDGAVEESGALAAWVALGGLMIVPAFLAAWLGVGLWRLDRAAWVGQVAAGFVVPLICGLFWAVGLARGPWAWILAAVAVLFAASLPILLRRSGRWTFGIGPDVVLAEIHARGETTVRDLARAFSVSPAVIATLLDQTIAQGSFAGAWDRAHGTVYSLGTVLSREALRRCPRCGGAIDALGNIARCPFCATEFAQLRGLDFPMPTPIGVCVITAFDRVLAYVASFLALMWTALFVGARLRPTGEDGAGLLWLIFVVGPLVLAAFALAVGRRLQAGRRAAWIAQQLLLPPAAPYLFLRRVRTLFSSGLAPLRARLKNDGELPLRELAAFLKVDERHAEEVAIHLTATGTLDSVLDWQRERLVHRDQLSVDGRERCKSCGAPLRFGGLCAFCGTQAANLEGVPPRPERPPASGWLFATFVVRASAFAVVFIVMATTPTTRPPDATAPSSRAVQEIPLDVALSSARGYDPSRQEVGWVGGGVTYLGFDPNGRLLSGDQNGFFVWDLATRARSLRTPDATAEPAYAGAHWAGFIPGTDTFYYRPYHATLFRGTAADWRLEARIDFGALHRAVHRRDGGAHLPRIAATTLTPAGVPLVLFAGRAAHLHELRNGEPVIELPVEAPFELALAAMDQSGRRVALLARDPTERVDGGIRVRDELIEVWDVESRTRIFQWKPRMGSTPWVLLVNERGRLAFSPDGRFLVTLDGTDLRYWDIAAGRNMRIPNLLPAGPIAFSSDGRTLAVARRRAPGQDAVGVAVFRVGQDALTPLGTLDGHEGAISAIALDASGGLVVAGDTRGAVRFWSLGP